MKKLSALLALLCPLAAVAAPAAESRECLQSPGKVIELCVFAKGGEAFYTVSRQGAPVLAESRLGMRFKGEQDPRYSGIGDARRTSSDGSWEQPWGEQRVIRDTHSEMTVTLSGDTPLNKAVDVTFRLFDEGFGFRYDYKSVPEGQPVEVIAEHTQFHPLGTYKAWWYNGLGQERDEYLYSTTDARRVTLAETPLTLKRSDGLHISIHEAAMVDFPSMLLSHDGAGTYTAWLMPWPDGVLARRTGPFTTPWRTVLITDSAGALADSRMELNLNEPNKLGPVPYFKPGKFVGVWWEMHLAKATWGSGPKHGATTAEVERYIDFAAKNNIQGVLAEGWNKGWDGEWIDNGDKFSFTESYPDFDLNAVTAYARSKGVQFIGHNETAGAVVNYENQLEGAMALYEKAGVSIVKTGYVKHSGTIVDRQGGLEWFAGQYL
ncbi:MAG TPA: glycoside hydrolase family 97 N-terminal domain-containing protein, partial [Magnetospirillaceae bacterium]|nr:glycoside hydrolase family 97 N-terminal domain-containing protein [Magnetospirillaceae bacterium]